MPCQAAVSAHNQKQMDFPSGLASGRQRELVVLKRCFRNRITEPWPGAMHLVYTAMNRTEMAPALRESRLVEDENKKIRTKVNTLPPSPGRRSPSGD